MKTIYQYIVYILHGLISLALIGYVYILQNHSNQTTYKTITPSRPVISETYNLVAWGEMGANPESTMRSREMIQKEPYWISQNPGITEIEVNIPRFFDESLEKQDIFYEKIAGLIGSHVKYHLILNISGNTHIDVSKMQRLLENIWDYQSVTFVFYDIPENYYDIFERWNWQNFNEKDIIIRFFGQMFPDKFSLDALILHVSNMIKKGLNPGDIINSLSFEFEETSDIGFIIDSTSEGEAGTVLQNIPTKNLYAERIIINSSPMGPEDTLKGKSRVEKFFKESPIKSIVIDRVGKKENGIITLYGF